jgi:hypothetical protein
MKSSLILFLLLLFSWNLSAKTITGVYECEGTIKKREFSLEIDKNGNYTRTARTYVSNGDVITDTDSGKNFKGNLKLIALSVNERQRVVKKDGVATSIQDIKPTLKLKGLKSIPKLKKGLKFTGSVTRDVTRKVKKENGTYKMNFTVDVLGQEAMRHPVLGNLTVWNIKQVFKNDEATEVWKIEAKYHPDYGFIHYDEKDTSDGKVSYTEKCKLANWK